MVEQLDDLVTRLERELARALKSGLTGAPSPPVTSLTLATDRRLWTRRRDTPNVSAAAPSERERGGTVGGAFAESLQRAVAPDRTERPPEALERAGGALHPPLFVAAGATC